jgi:hypothetical protein
MHVGWDDEMVGYKQSIEEILSTARKSRHSYLKQNILRKLKPITSHSPEMI